MKTERNETFRADSRLATPEFWRVLYEFFQAEKRSGIGAATSMAPSSDLAWKRLAFSPRVLAVWACWNRDFRHFKEDIRPELVAGTSSVIPGGLKKYCLSDEQGQVEEFVRSLPSEPQSLPDVAVDQHFRLESDRSEDDASASIRAKNVISPVKDRLEGLQEWMAEDNDAAAEFIVSELASTPLAADWRNVLIYAADAVRFRDPAVRTKAVDVLLKNATCLRHSNEPAVFEVVWCVIHRIGSIIPVHRAGELTSFLGPCDPVDTRLATLQAVVRIFEVAPLDVPEMFAELADRVVVLATKLWDRDVSLSFSFRSSDQ